MRKIKYNNFINIIIYFIKNKLYSTKFKLNVRKKYSKKKKNNRNKIRYNFQSMLNNAVFF